MRRHVAYLPAFVVPTPVGVNRPLRAARQRENIVVPTPVGVNRVSEHGLYPIHTVIGYILWSK